MEIKETQIIIDELIIDIDDYIQKCCWCKAKVKELRNEIQEFRSEIINNKNIEENGNSSNNK